MNSYFYKLYNKDGSFKCCHIEKADYKEDAESSVKSICEKRGLIYLYIERFSSIIKTGENQLSLF